MLPAVAVIPRWLPFALAVAAGGVVATPNVGLKLDGRVYATIVSGDSSMAICGPGICLLHVHVGVLWQADFNAGVVFSF